MPHIGQVPHWSPSGSSGITPLRRAVVMNEELRAELLERAERDQAARTSLPPEPTWQQWQELVPPLDQANTARLREIVAELGWPGHELAGVDGAHAASLLVPHAPAEFQEECLPLLENAVARGGVLELRTVRDPAGLDERRGARGLAPEAENRARLLAARKPGRQREDEEPAGG